MTPPPGTGDYAGGAAFDPYRHGHLTDGGTDGHGSNGHQRDPAAPRNGASGRAGPDGPDGPDTSDTCDIEHGDAEYGDAEHGGVTELLVRPWFAAMVCNVLDPRPGQHVLHIARRPRHPRVDDPTAAGAHATTAVLLAHRVAPGGTVTILSDDPGFATALRDLLPGPGPGGADVSDVAELPDVVGAIQVLHTDPDRPPAAGPRPDGPFQTYDRILCPAPTTIVPPRWRRVLRPDGRLVLTLRLRGRTCALASLYPHQDDAAQAWQSHRLVLVPPDLAHDDVVRVPLSRNREITLIRTLTRTGPGRAGTGEPELPDGASIDVFTHRRRETGTGVRIVPAELGPLELWIAATLPDPGPATLEYTTTAATSGALRHPLRTDTDSNHTLAYAAGGSVAYLTALPTDGTDGPLIVSVTAHGPHARTIGIRLAETIQAWDAHHRPPLTLTVRTGDLPLAPAASENVITTGTQHIVITPDVPR